MADPKKILGGLGKIKERLLAESPPAYSPKILESTTAKFADKIADANPKLTDAEVQKKALAQATKKLEWERVQKPALEKKYGALGKASFADSNPNKMQNTAEVVAERKRKANEFLNQPTEPWTPPRKELQAFDRSSIKDAMEGFPDVEQSSFPRDIPTRASTSHVDELYADPENRALIEKQIKRGLPLGGETFYGSLYPVKQAVQEAGIPVDKFDKWIHSLAPASARNSIMNEMAVGQFLRNMNARGIPLTEENVAKEMAAYKDKFGIGLPLMPIHRQGVANVLEGGQNLREMSKANIPTNYKIPTYGTQKAGDFSKSVVLDVHEAGGHTQGSRFHPYFNEQGGFGNTEYGAGEQGLLGIAQDLGIPGGMAQAGRWFGGGELTGLRSPRGDALDLLEKQVAYTLKQKGIQPNPANVRAEVLNQIKTGEGDLLPYYRKEAMPDVRETGLQRAEGGEVNMEEADQRLRQAIQQRMAKGGKVSLEASDAKLRAAIQARMAKGGQVGFKQIQFMDKGGKVGKIAKGIASVRDRLLADPEKKTIQAPSIIIPSKISDVKEAVRQSKGEYGARRVERAADEIPNLDKLYKEQALREAFLGDNAKALMTMNPAKFEKYSEPLKPGFTDAASTRFTTSGKRLTYPEYMEDYLPNVGAFNDVPFLEINKQKQGSPLMPFISGHEGRHRSRVMVDRGDEAGLVQLLPRYELREPFPRRSQEEYIEALKEELLMTNNKVRPEQIFEGFNKPNIKRPPVKLPDIYAEGGPAFKKLTFMDKGGKVGKVASGLGKVGKRLMADNSLPALEREANLQKFLAESKAPMRLYHGTTATEGGKGQEAIRRLKPSKDGALGSGVYMTPKTNYSDQYTYKGAGNYEGGNTLPVHAQIKNPLVIDGSASNDPMIEALIRLGMGESQASRMVERAYDQKGYIGKEVQTRAQAQGYDGLMQYRDGDLNEVVSYNPNAVKSAIGNQGTYDINQPDLSKAHGGLAYMDKGGKAGKVVSGLDKVRKRLLGTQDLLPAAEREENLQKFLGNSRIRERLYHATPKNFSAFKPGGDDPTLSGPAIWLTPDATKQPAAHNIGSRSQEFREGVNVMPVYAQARSPLLLDDKLSIEWAREVYADGSREFPDLIAPKTIEELKKGGYDSIIHADPYGNRGGEQEIIMFEPNKIKSAIGNRGTYDINEPDITKAEGGVAFKKLQFMDKGGVTTSAGSFSPEELGVTANDLRLIDEKEWNTIKDNAPATYEWIKQNIKDEANQLKSARGMKDFALRVGASYAGGIPDLINFGLMGADLVQSAIPSISKPESVLDVAGSKDRIPKFKLASDKPWFGGEQYIDAMHKAGLLGENQFPVAEGVAGVLMPAGLIKKGIKKGAQLFSGKKPEETKKRQGGLTAMAR